MLHNFPEIINAATTDGGTPHFTPFRATLASLARSVGRSVGGATEQERRGENGCVSELISGPFPSLPPSNLPPSLLVESTCSSRPAPAQTRRRPLIRWHPLRIPR